MGATDNLCDRRRMLAAAEAVVQEVQLQREKILARQQEVRDGRAGQSGNPMGCAL